MWHFIDLYNADIYYAYDLFVYLLRLFSLLYIKDYTYLRVSYGFYSLFIFYSMILGNILLK